jgi:hypothetical protein
MKIVFTKVGDRMEVTQAECENFEEVEAFRLWYAGKPVQQQQQLPLETEQ